MTDWHTRLNASKSLLQAAQTAPVLAQFDHLMSQSKQRLGLVLHLIPHSIRAHVQAGPADETTWCLLVPNTAIATKLRHLLPDMERHLLMASEQRLKIRVKVLEQRRGQTVVR